MISTRTDEIHNLEESLAEMLRIITGVEDIGEDTDINVILHTSPFGYNGAAVELLDALRERFGLSSDGIAAIKSKYENKRLLIKDAAAELYHLINWSRR